MRVVFFGSGGLFAQSILGALSEPVELIAVVAPAARGRIPLRWWRSLRIARAGRSFEELSRSKHLAFMRYRNGGDERCLRRLRELEPDLLLIGSFPYVIPSHLRAIAKFGALNIHPSVLPKHRGPDPIFWTYHADDRTAGVTVHWLDDSLDGGDIAGQQVVELARGTTSTTLTAKLAHSGASLAAAVIDEISAGRSRRTPQDERLATTEPLPAASRWSIDCSEWPAERLWHFLRGVGRSHGALIKKTLPAGEAIEFASAPHPYAPGSVRADGVNVRIYTADGWVVATRAR